MLRRLIVALILNVVFCKVVHVNAWQVVGVQPKNQTINKDTLKEILILQDTFLRQKRLITFTKVCIQSADTSQLSAIQDTFNYYFSKYNLPNKQIFSLFVKGVSYNKLRDYKNAETYVTRALQIAQKNNKNYLSFLMLSHLGFILTDKGDYIGAIYNYRLATIEVKKLKDNFRDNRREASLNINISDLFYKSGFYSQSLNYLDRAWKLLVNDSTSKRLLSSVIFYNKSENFFRMNKLDSLKEYHKRLNGSENENYKLFTYRKRVAYYITLLQHNYDLAITQIKDLQKAKDYVASDLENQHLADAYYMSGRLDSAKLIIDKLLTADTENSHPEIKYHLYETLAWIAGKKGDHKASSYNFMLALKQSQENNIRLTQVGNISSQIKIDETESLYQQKAEVYKRERLWLLFIVMISALSIIAIALFYRNIRQKRHYEKLLYEAKKEELAFINSHEIRKHLTNILGMIDILKNSENRLEEYEQVEPFLYQSASMLDESIKNISEKLNED